jgi:hypothetical protein
LVAVGIALGFAVQAQAATLPMSGTLSLKIRGSFFALPEVVLPSGGSTPILVSSGSGGFTEPANVFGPTTFSLPASLFTGIPQISGLTLTDFGNGTKVVNGVAGTATGGLAGYAIITILQSLNLSIPLSVVGSPGGVAQAGAGGIQVTVVGQGWTTGVVMHTGVTTTTPGTNVLNTATVQGSDSRTAGHAGSITLVSGFQALTNTAGAFPGFAIQSLTFATPEAGTFLLLGSGTIAVALYCRRRMRR